MRLVAAVLLAVTINACRPVVPVCARWDPVTRTTHC